MGKYKGKRLQQSRGIIRSNVKRIAALPPGEETGKAQAAGYVPTPQLDAVLPPDEEAVKVQAARDVPAPQPDAVLPPDEEAVKVQAAGDVSVPQPDAVLPPDEETGKVQAAGDVSALQPDAVLPPDEETGTAQAAGDVPVPQPDVVLPPDEETGKAQAAGDVPVLRPDAVLLPDEETGKAQAAGDVPVPQPDAVLPPDEETGTAQAAGDVPVHPDVTASRQKKNKWFLIGLAFYGALLLAVSGFLQISLWRFLKNAQAEMDRLAAEQAAQQAHEKALRQAPQLAFEDWQSGLNADYWTDLWYAKAPGSLDARESVRGFMAERFSPDAVEAYKAAGYSSETPVYVLKNGEDSLARVTLAGSELNWSVSEVELLLEGTYSVSVTVADGCRVYCNGREMGEEYAGSTESRFRYELLEDRLEGAVTWVRYSAEGLLLEPELTVEPPEGYCTIQAEEGEYLLGLAGDAGAFTDRAVAFVKSYLYYYMSGGYNTYNNMYSVLSHLTYGTRAYQDIVETYDGVVWTIAYSGIDTSKTTAGDVLVWADNCFSVDVAYDADCQLAGVYVDYADAVMRVYFLQTGAGYIISNFETL